MAITIPTISIAQVLSEIRSSTDHTAPFLLRIVVGSGRSKGSIRTIAKCLKGFPEKQVDATKAASNGTHRILYKEHDKIPIIDIEDGHQFKTISISHIIGYNQYQVMH